MTSNNILIFNVCCWNPLVDLRLLHFTWQLILVVPMALDWHRVLLDHPLRVGPELPDGGPDFIGWALDSNRKRLHFFLDVAVAVATGSVASASGAVPEIIFVSVRNAGIEKDLTLC